MQTIDQTYLNQKSYSEGIQGQGIAAYIKQQDNASGVGLFQGEYFTKSEKVNSDTGTLYMGDATIQRPGDREDKDKEDSSDKLASLQGTSALDRSNQIAVLSNTTTPEDLKQIEEEGYSLDAMDSRTIITVTDKIKAVYEQAGVDVSYMGGNLSQQEMEDITGNAALASQISSSLSTHDLPLTQENAREMTEASQQLESMKGISSSSIAYMVDNGLEPTLANLYKASYSAGGQGDGSANALSQEDFAALQSQVETVITEAGYQVNEESLATGKWMLDQGLELSGANFSYTSQLQSLANQFTDMTGSGAGQTFEAMATAIAEGGQAGDAYLLSGYSLKDQAQSANDTIQNVSDQDLALVVETGKEVTIADLRTQMQISARKEQEANRDFQKKQQSQETGRFLTAKRQLEETRLLMTSQANYSLLKKGISIDTQPLSQLVETLKNQENDYYSSILQEAGLEASEANVSTYSEIQLAMAELKTYPAETLTQPDTDTLRGLHQAGATLKARYEEVGERYETMGTQVRTDLGDSMTKAFQNVDTILTDLGMETTEANQRAVRILGYSSTEITTENIESVKAKDQQVQRLFRQMTPAVTLELIRKGENPLDSDLTTLGQEVEEIASTTTNTDSQRYEKFLRRLEEKGGISQEERTSYIGIYRLITQVEKTDGAALGDLMKQGGDLTLRNLLTAVRSKKKGSMDYSVDDDFDGLEDKTTGEKIDDQIATAFQLNVIRDNAQDLTPEKVERLYQETQSGTLTLEAMTPEQLKDFLQRTQSQVAEEEDQAYLQQLQEESNQFTQVLSASEDVYSYLENHGFTNSLQHIQAAQQILTNPGAAVRRLFGQTDLRDDLRQEISDLKDQIYERFGEALKHPEEMADAQEALADTAEHCMEGMIMDDDVVTSLDVRQLRSMCMQLHMAAETAQEESYLIPMETSEGEVTGVSLRVIRGSKEEGGVDLLFRGETSGRVAASFTLQEGILSGMVACQKQETTQAIRQELSRFTEALQAQDKLEENTQIQVSVTAKPDLSLEHFASASDVRKARMEAGRRDNRKAFEVQAAGSGSGESVAAGIEAGSSTRNVASGNMSATSTIHSADAGNESGNSAQTGAAENQTSRLYAIAEQFIQLLSRAV